MADVKKASTKSATAETKTTEAKVAKTTPAEVAKAAVTARKEAEKKEAAPMVKEEKKVVKKTTTAKKSAGKRAKKAPVEKVREVFFEYGEKQVLTQDIVNKIEEAWKAEGHRVATIKTLRVYVKAEDDRAYYVINDNDEGKFVEI